MSPLLTNGLSFCGSIDVEDHDCMCLFGLQIVIG